MRKKVLITSALPYVNNSPHLGNIIGSVLSADCFARYCRLKGHETLFIGGTDEYGSPTEIQAIKERCLPIEICNKYHEIHRQVYQWFNCSFDIFGRTTNQHHRSICHDIFHELSRNNYINEKSIHQLYCQDCQRFLADRYVEGQCYLCQFPEARGDQCDKCSQLLDANKLIQPKCKICHSTSISIKETNHLFLDLKSLEHDLSEWHTEVLDGWSNNASKTTKSWMVKGLQERCISRDLKWGINIPGYDNKVFYVWFDAPIGYISITASLTPEWKDWWTGETELYQFMGKDNVPFHSLIFPGVLLGTKNKWILPKAIYTTEYLNYEGGKFSKSRNTGIFGNDVISLNLPSFVWRYYLFSIRPESSDSSFQWHEFVDRNNGELLAKFGNYCHRTLCLTKKYLSLGFNDFVKNYDELIKKVDEHIIKYIEYIEKGCLREALRKVIDIAVEGNVQLNKDCPWKSIKNNFQEASDSIFLACNLIYHLAYLAWPFVPTLSNEILKQLGCKEIDNNSKYEFAFKFVLEKNHKISNNIVPLVPLISNEEKLNYIDKFGIK